MSSFKSNENIHKKEDGSYYVVSANTASSNNLWILNCVLKSVYKNVDEVSQWLVHSQNPVLRSHTVEYVLQVYRISPNNVEAILKQNYLNIWSFYKNLSRPDLLKYQMFPKNAPSCKDNS